jgi:hypothetical protein
VAVPVAGVALLLALTACSGDAAATATATESEAAQAPADSAGGQVPGGGGVAGEIAAVDDALLQVQGDDGQTAVSWDAGTVITQTVAAALTDVTAGVCVVATTASDDSGDSGDSASTAAATSVAVTAATDGECSGFGGRAGGAPSGELPDGAPTGMPEGTAPTDAPDGGDRPGGSGFGAVTAGLVTAVDGSTITVQPGDAAGDDSGATTITVDDATTYTTTVAADASAISVGRCVTAQGEADDSGQVAATSLVLSDAGEEGCSTGLGGRGGSGGAMPGAPDAGSSDAGTTSQSEAGDA